MGFRARFRNYSIEQRLDEWVAPLVEHRVLGFTSKAQVMHYALRKLLDQYLEWGIHPWSTRKQQEPPSVLPAGVAAVVLAGLVFAGLFSQGLGPTGAATTALSVPVVYDKYAAFLDFFLYLAFFIGVVQVGLGRTIPNRVVTISLAAVLAVGAATMEPVLGFSLKTLGPLAIALFILFTALLVYRALRAFEVHRGVSCAVLLVLLYVGIAAYLPKSYGWLTGQFPLLPLAIVIGIGYVIIRMTHVPAGSPAGGLSWLGGSFRSEVGEEEHVVREFIQRLDGRRDARRLASDLVEVIELLDRVGSNPEAREALARRLSGLLPKTSELETTVSRLERLCDQIRAVDLRFFTSLRETFPKLPAEQQRAVREEVKALVGKLDLEARCKQLAALAKQHLPGLRTLLADATAALRTNDLARAKAALMEALRQEQQVCRTLEEIRGIENDLLAITQHELKSLTPK